MKPSKDSVLVVGAGIAGVRSALDLAERGYRVTLVERAPCIGGVLVQLDRQFPNDACGICRMLPLLDRDASSQYCLRRGMFHANVRLMLSSQVRGLEGEPGAFRAEVEQAPARVDPDRCNGCAKCVEVCPVEVPDDFNAGWTKRKAVHLPVPYNASNGYVIDPDGCTLCGECEKACPTDAIRLDKEAVRETVEAGAVVVATGLRSYVPAGDPPYNHVLEGVVTSTELERLLSGTGPRQGKLSHPGDGREIRKIAWLQCTGSRDLSARADFCSSACCMFSIKEALMVKEQSGGRVDTAIFYMDMRTFGKGHQRYRDRAEKEMGVRFVRSRVHSIRPSRTEASSGPSSPSGGLVLSYIDDGGSIHKEAFDLVVLAAGQRPPNGTEALASATRLPLDEWGFPLPKKLSLTETSVPGIYLAGSASGLKDISESVVQAGAASAKASSFLRGLENGISSPKSPPRLVDFSSPPSLCTPGRMLRKVLVAGGGLTGMKAA